MSWPAAVVLSFRIVRLGTMMCNYQIAVVTRPGIDGEARGARFSHHHRNSAPWADFPGD
jgi:hypothetical protein